MPINQTECNLEGITITIAQLEKEENKDTKMLEVLKKNRELILKRLGLYRKKKQTHLADLL
jgi:hypothetical protein